MLKKLTTARFWLILSRDIGILLLVIYLLNLYQSRHTTDVVPPLEGQLISGKTVNLKDLMGHGPVIVYFWGSWCPICSITSPTLSEIAEDYQVLSIALSSGNQQQVAEYLQHKQYHFDTMNDPDGQISQTWGVNVTPQVLIIDQEGKISATMVGLVSQLGILLRLWFSL